MNPKVSIIIPTYRRDNPLRVAIKSAFSQTYDNVEVLLIDDNAEKTWNDKVYDIVKDFPEIVYIKNETNLGSAKNRNIGIERASGDYITFLDDDDEYLPEKIERQLLAMQKEDADYSVTDLDLFYDNGKFFERKKCNYVPNDDPNALLKYHFMYHITAPDTMMFKTDYLRKIGGFDPIDVGDDFYLIFKAIKNGGKFIYIDDCSVKAVVHTQGSGLSSGEGKIKGENALYSFKKQHLGIFNGKEKRFIKVRHFAVLAFAKKRGKNILGFLWNGFLAFLTSPLMTIKFIGEKN